MFQGSLARAWSAWAEQWETHVYQKRLLAQSAARLSKLRALPLPLRRGAQTIRRRLRWRSP